VRILFSALGRAGHTFPLVPLALAVREAGHRVSFAIGHEVREAVASTGLDTVVVGGSMREAFVAAMASQGLTRRPSDPESMRSLAAEVFGSVLARRRLAGLRPWLLAHPVDLVIAEVEDPGAALAAAAAVVPCVLHSVGRRPGPRASVRALLTGPVLEVALEARIPLVEGDRLGHAYLDVWPPSLQSEPVGDEPPELALRSRAWNPPVPSSPRPEPGRPWVYLTLGTVFGNATLLRAAAAALARLPVDVLVASGSVAPGELADVRRARCGGAGAVRVASFVAQAELLASDTPPWLVVHHGGSGTTLAAAAAGIPQLFLPQGADQFANAAAVTAVGAGHTVATGSAAATTTDALIHAAGALLEDGAERTRAAALAVEIATMPSPFELAARIEEWGRP
jgi:UDP:flavonoid glycosyltransferase YjiC (YdhE family)